jgi:hypothetical protein
MKPGAQKRAQLHIATAIHEVDLAASEVGDVRPLDAARLRKLRDQLIAVKNNLRR